MLPRHAIKLLLPRLATGTLVTRAVLATAEDAPSPSCVFGSTYILPAAVATRWNGTGPSPPFNQGHVIIGQNYETEYLFTVPSILSDGQDKKCAIEFRLPYCLDLQEQDPEYECFIWTGLEQQSGMEAGMRWELADVDPDVNDWVASPLVQLQGGSSSLVGTFSCPKEGVLIMRFRVVAVNGWSLEFVQAGLLAGDGATDGVGAFGTPCEG